MSRFFDVCHDSDSESSLSGDEVVSHVPQAKLNTVNFPFSDDEVDVKRVLRSAKEKRYGDMQTAVRNIKNCKKNRDIGTMLTNFEDLWRAFVKAQNVINKEEGGGIPRFYVRCLVEGEDFINQLWEDKNARKNLSKIQSKSLATLRQKLRKYNREDRFVTEIASFRENPDLPDDDDDEDKRDEDDSDKSDSDDSDAEFTKKMTAASASKVNELSSRRPSKAPASDSKDSDSDDIDWDSSDMDSSSSDDDQDQYASMREYFLKPKTGRDEDFKKRQRKEERERARIEERERIRIVEDEDEEDGFERVKKGATPAHEKIKMFAKDAEITLSLVNKKFQEINAARGKRGNDRREMIDLLQELQSIAQQHQMSAAMLVKIRMGVIAAIFDYNMAIRVAMKSDMWEKVKQCVDELLDHLIACPVVTFGEEIVEETESLEQEPYRVAGCMVAVIERLDDEFVKMLKNSDPHKKEYFDRLRDEHSICRLIEKTVQLLEMHSQSQEQQQEEENVVQEEEEDGKVAAAAATMHYTTPHELCRIYLKRIEHIYFKVDEQVFRADEGSVESGDSTTTSVHTMDQLCKYIYANDRTAMLRTRAILFHIYHHAIHDHWYEARDLMLMSHLQTNIQNADVVTKTFYNRTMVQLGLCAFRHGHVREAHNALLEVQSSPRVKELLAQGSSQRRDDLSSEQAELNRLRELPYHMHINLELVECVYLVSAMLIEVPYMAAHEVDARRRFISKSFHYQLRNAAHKYDLVGPPELMREHVVAASKAMRRGDWRACRDFVVNDAMNAKVWHRFYGGGGARADRVRALITRKVQEETLRTYLFTYGAVYDSLSLPTLANVFELSVRSVHAIVSKMIIGGELMGSLDEPTQSLVMHRTDPSRLQSTALQLADKLAIFVENNERLMDVKLGNESYYGRGGAGGGGMGRDWGGRGGARGDRRQPRRIVL